METDNTARQLSASTAPPQLIRIDSPSSTAIKPATWLVGLSGYAVFAWIYDYLGYGFAIWLLGPLVGGILMAIITIPVDLYCLKLYDWSQTDWLAIEYIKSVRTYRGTHKLKNFIGRTLSALPDWALVLVLAVKFNAFIITAFLRDGAYSYQTMTKKDWIVFWYSSIACQLYWILVVSLGIEGIKLLSN